jgi:thymidylate synthase
MRIYSGQNFAEVYEESLRDIFYSPEYETSPRGMKVKETLNAALVIEDPVACCYDNKIRSSQYSYIAGELLWYFSGRDDAKFISNFSKFWLNIQTPYGSANSAYGDLIFVEHKDEPISQWNWAYESLIRDKDTRQAIMHFNRPYHQYFENKDFVCTLNAVFHIRDNRLYLTVYMRSNDAIMGLPTDVAFFTMLQRQMLKHLKIKYADLKLGTYTHVDSSLHIYENNFDTVEEMLEYEFRPTVLPDIGLDLVGSDGIPSDTLNLITYDVEKHIENINSGKLSKLDPEIISDDLYRWIIEKINLKKKF